MSNEEEGYKPPPEFQEDHKDPLVGVSMTDSTELWLIQWPLNQLQPDDFQGKEITLKLHRNGKLGSFESLSGKSYELVSFASQQPDASVFITSASESKVVGKISRRVSLVSYPDPGDFVKPQANPLQRLSSQRPEGSLRSHSSYLLTPASSRRHRDSGTASGISSDGRRSSSKHSKKQRVDGPSPSSGYMRSADRFTRDSGRSTISSLGATSEESAGTKLKRKIKVEE